MRTGPGKRLCAVVAGNPRVRCPRKRVAGIPELSTNDDWVEPAVPLPTGTVLNKYSGGFGMVGGWQSEQMAPPGIEPVVVEESLFSEIGRQTARSRTSSAIR